MSDPVTAATTDAELTRRIRADDGPGRAAANEVARRHRTAVMSYAQLCCAQDAGAQELADEAVARTLAAVRAGTGPSPGWRQSLLAEVRRTAAAWADTERHAELTAGFTAWLNALPRTATGRGRGRGRGRSAAQAAAAAESASTLLQAFLSLPPARQTDLWHYLEECPTDGALPKRPATAGTPDTLTRQHLHDAYLQTYTPRAPHRSCRHLLGALSKSVRRGTAHEARELDRHLARCARCRHAHADLTAIRTWERPVLLRALLLWTGEADAVPTSPAPSAFSRARARRPRGGGRRLVDARRLLVFPVVVGAGALTALVAASVIVAAVDATGTRAPLAGGILLPAPPTFPPPTGDAPASPPPDTTTPPLPASPSPSASPAAPASSASPGPTASPSPSPSPSPSATSAAPSPSTPLSTSPSAAPSTSPSTGTVGTVGFRLVNSSSGLCVGTTDDGVVAVRLQQCTGDGSQGWQRLAVDQDAFQLRNTGTGQCLDGTTDSGDTVAVILQPCRSDAGRTEQLWRLVPDAAPGSFRLWFLPTVAAGAYSAHLLGPQDWALTDLPRTGSPLVQLPDYDNSGSFDFTMG